MDSSSRILNCPAWIIGKRTTLSSFATGRADGKKPWGEIVEISGMTLGGQKDYR